jgi:hypothetical protein
MLLIKYYIPFLPVTASLPLKPIEFWAMISYLIWFPKISWIYVHMSGIYLDIWWCIAMTSISLYGRARLYARTDILCLVGTTNYPTRVLICSSIIFSQYHYELTSGCCAPIHTYILLLLYSLLATDVMYKSSPMKSSKDVHEPSLRAVPMMLLSPNRYFLTEASFKLSEVVPCLGDDYLSILLSSLESNTMRSVTTSFDSSKIMTNLMNLACLVVS